MEFENLKVGDLIMETIDANWAIWNVQEISSDGVTCEIVDCAGTGWVSKLELSNILYSLNRDIKYIGNIDDLPELLL